MVHESETVVLSGNTVAGKLADFGGGAWLSASTVTMVNNTIARNVANGNGGGALLSGATMTRLVNNTITCNRASSEGGGVRVWLGDSTNEAELYNNIFWGNEADDGADLYVVNDGLGEDEPAPTTLANNVLNQNGEGLVFTLPVAIDSSNLDGDDPKFVAAACGNYRLRADSPVLNRGTNDAPDLPETDQSEAPRISDGTVDLGALEFTGTGLESQCAQGPDLNGTLTKVKVKDSGNKLIVKLEVCNTGIDPISGPFDLSLFLSDTAQIETDAVPLQTFSIEALAAGGCQRSMNECASTGFRRRWGRYRSRCVDSRDIVHPSAL